ncbi:hypothetical protein GCM10011341_29640 [Frigidibacter albus]|nr:hypothetical protein GCM10011341_29640 [Frigidibacter albus]
MQEVPAAALWRVKAGAGRIAQPGLEALVQGLQPPEHQVSGSGRWAGRPGPLVRAGLARKPRRGKRGGRGLLMGAPPGRAATVVNTDRGQRLSAGWALPGGGKAPCSGQEGVALKVPTGFESYPAQCPDCTPPPD